VVASVVDQVMFMVAAVAALSERDR
jgi:hypothetical protein